MITIVGNEFASLGASLDYAGSFGELMPHAIDLYVQKFYGSTHNLESSLLRFGAILCGVGREFITKLGDEALSRPSASLAKSANCSSCDVIRDAREDIRISLVPSTLQQTTRHFAHPERTFAAGSALAAGPRIHHETWRRSSE